MKAVEYTLPPNVYRKQAEAAASVAHISEDSTTPLAYLEIEVSRINFITDKSIKAQASGAASLYKNSSAKAGGFKAQIIWWGEQRETAGSVSISCGGITTPKDHSEVKRKNQKQRSSEQQQQQQQQQQRHQHHHHTNNKLRYSVRSSLALFLDYLCECPPIEIVASGFCSSSSHRDDVNDHEHTLPHTHPRPPVNPLGQTRLPLPTPLLRKYAANYVNGCNFEYKTKIYALYRHVESGAASGKVQQQQQLKVGEIQLRFRMLFAANAPCVVTPPTTTTTSSSELSSSSHLKMPAALLQEQLTGGGGYLPANNSSNHHNNNTKQKRQQQQPGQRIAGEKQPNNNNSQKCKSSSSKVRPAGKSAEIMEAMKKLDAGLAALFATAEPLEQLKIKQQQRQQLDDVANELWPGAVGIEQLDSGAIPGIEELFKTVNSIQLDMEALTLQAEGTKRMELQQSEVRPIFTVECQLSHDLIKQVERYDMFHIMQFESEKFQSLTQCTRFGQMAQRDVHLPQSEDGEISGHIDFTVWWREPGTCLNEMLGMGRLHLVELYKASLLEQCKCIVIQRRGVHLASLYLKISLRSDAKRVKSVANGHVDDEQQAANNNNSTNNNNNNNNSNGNNINGAHAAGNIESTTNNNNNKILTSDNSNTNQNRPSVETVNFMAETSKVRLLRGYICVDETRQLSASDAASCVELSVQSFWQSQPLVVPANNQGAFQLKEQFAIINDEKFLQSVERQQLTLELRPMGGLVRLPLHQFFIAYRDASITNHLCKGKLPVISFDGWAPILHPQTQAQLGELKCLLAVGSQAQIDELRQQREVATVTAPPLDNDSQEVPLRRTADLLDMLQNALSAPPPPPPSTHAPHAVASAPQTSHFKFALHIVGAAGLPLNPGYGKSKKQAKRQAAAKRFVPNEPPNTYVTFQAVSCSAPTYKSHEGLVYATPIVERSTTPQWRCKLEVTVTADYLSNQQKLFILKLWKKASVNGAATPTPLEDAIIGFAALNLSQKPLPSGWHNIVDFSGRVTGGLEAHVLPLPLPGTTPTLDTDIEQFEQSLELTHLQIGQAIKRKFNELEQISQRLRTRLVDVTGESLGSQFDVASTLDNWQAMEQLRSTEGDDDNDDDLVADFERALRTPSPPPLSNANVAPTAQLSADKSENSNGAKE
ncbi:uncharacterized protein LOC115629448 isoform X2 [Scaptodrosophila lebanonensis]|uniref:Uncharacterized protein LOC115629448 isoform X2 n=1 Tax=Drosophila lebanonensis TaxID=7225 RepID=A0A6J2U3T0_DROLE|nr:uncharacterized protein LOC115629448 isoform X2 [Scaptodrosophila lebanonensis]